MIFSRSAKDEQKRRNGTQLESLNCASSSDARRRPNPRWRRGWDCSAHPCASPLAALGASLRLSNFVPDKIVEPSEFVHTTPIHRNAKRPLGAFAFLAERVGFEPTLRHNRKPDFESGAFDHSATSPEM